MFRGPLVRFLVVLALLMTSVFPWVWWVEGREPKTPGGDQKELAQAFLQAVEAVRFDQTSEGYWFTLQTTSPVFKNPKPEVNVWLPAMLVDLLQPVAQETCLTDVLGRAREFLRGQIEPTGLVRYFGKPDQPYIPKFGCEITPDSDDTSLVWRLAPRDDRALLQSALRVVKQYRTAEGLYRTWLAQPESYKCVDRGHDPNPADIAVQMHVYLFLAKYDPESARKLCDAFRNRMSEDRLWVWCKVAPVVPVLREADLFQAGCPIGVPEARLRQAVPGQEPYLELGQLLRDLILHREPQHSRDKFTQALKRLAEGGFLKLKRTPPLLYHDDFSSGHRRSYWSENLGYAMWIRAYVEGARRWQTDFPLPACSAKTSEAAFGPRNRGR